MVKKILIRIPAVIALMSLLLQQSVQLFSQT